MTSEKLEYVKQYIGSESQLKSFFESNTLNHKEQQSLQWAYDELSKDRPNMMFIDDAYRIIHAKTTKAVAEEEDESVLEAGEKSENKKFCSNCGNEIEAGAKFCSKCGNAVSVKVEKSVDSVKGKSKSKKVIATIIMMIGIVLLLSFIGNIADNATLTDRVHNYSQKYGLSGFKEEEVRDYMRAVYPEKVIAQNRRNENLFMLSGFLIFILAGILTYMWRVPSSEAEKYEREQNIKLAPATRRVLAYLIDIILLLIAGSIVEVMHLPNLLTVAALFFYFAYMVYMLSSDTNNGQTIGLKVMKLRVMKENRSPLTKKDGLLYILFLFVMPSLITQLGVFFGYLASSLPLIYFFNRKRKLIQNFITQTVVVSIVPKELRG